MLIKNKKMLFVAALMSSVQGGVRLEWYSSATVQECEYVAGELSLKEQETGELHIF